MVSVFVWIKIFLYTYCMYNYQGHRQQWCSVIVQTCQSVRDLIFGSELVVSPDILYATYNY